MLLIRIRITPKKKSNYNYIYFDYIFNYIFNYISFLITF